MSNPWITEQPPAPAPAAAGGLPLTGPAAPQGGIVPADRELQLLPVPAGHLVVVGAHGGSGESTIAAALAGFPTDHRWPVPDRWMPDTPHRTLLVARSSYVGLRAAQRALRQWAAQRAGTAHLLALVLTAAAPGRRDRELARLQQVVAGGAPRVLELAWDAQLLLTDPEVAHDFGPQYRQLRDAVARL